jgi:UDP-N-acetylmuramoyl-L-alanyl-D-glutamate--2,6-diaminopimelate ligase
MNPITFDVAIFTNLSEEHLDFHNNMEDYYKAKERLFLQAKSAVVNVDCGAGKRLYSFLCEQEVLKKSCSRVKGDFCALDEKISTGGIEYVLIKNNDKCKAQTVKCSICGGFQVMNSLQAIATAELCGIDSSLSCAALEKINVVSGRLERVSDCLDGQNDIDVFIDYAHTPDALERLLRSVRAMQPKESRIILLFGCGGDRDKSKRKVMGSIASRLADFVVVTSDNSRSEAPMSIIKDILKGIDKEKEFVVIESRREAIFDAIVRYARSKDTVVLAGKGHEPYEITADGKHPFDERRIVRCALEERNKCDRKGSKDDS